MKNYNGLICTINKLCDETSEVVDEGLKMLLANENNLTKYVCQTTWELYTRQRVDLLISENIRRYKELLDIWKNMLEVGVSLQKGFLHPLVCPPNVLEEILDKAAEMLHSEKPDYKLTFNRIQDYYGMANIAFVAERNLEYVI